MPSLFIKWGKSSLYEVPLFDRPTIDRLLADAFFVKIKNKEYYGLINRCFEYRGPYIRIQKKYFHIMNKTNDIFLEDMATAVLYKNGGLTPSTDNHFFKNYQYITLPDTIELNENDCMTFEERKCSFVTCPEAERATANSIGLYFDADVQLHKKIFYAPKLKYIANNAFKTNVDTLIISENCDVSNCDNWGLGNDTTIVTWDKSKKLNLKTKRWENLSGGAMNCFKLLIDW